MKVDHDTQKESRSKSFFSQVVEHSEVPVRCITEVGEVALAGLIAGRDDAGPRMEPIAVLADGCTKVQLEPKASHLPEKFSIGCDELLGLPVDDGRVTGLEGLQQILGPYLSGYSRSMQVGVRMLALRRKSSAFP
jgi:hypothetical protein